MKLEIFSYRYAQEVLQHPNYSAAWDEVTAVFSEAPVFIWPGKSRRVARLSVVQQVLNTYFDRRLAVDNNWDYHPLATNIEGSNLRADFRKRFGDLGIQVEVQFGNMARWYSDVFKFQAGYSAEAINLGISVVPMSRLANRIDQNVVNWERARRELPSAKLSITLPIALIGIDDDETTTVVDLRQTQFGEVQDFTGRGNEENRWRVVHGYLTQQPLAAIGPESPVGPMLVPLPEDDEADAEGDGA